MSLRFISSLNNSLQKVSCGAEAGGEGRTVAFCHGKNGSVFEGYGGEGGGGNAGHGNDVGAVNLQEI